MCIAIAKNIGVDVPSEETLRHCWDNNPDGAGFAFAHEGNVFIKKGFMTWDNFINSFKFWDNKINFKNKGLLIHFRIATHGGTNASMTHPFPIETDEGALSKPEYITLYAVVHNGIISLTSSKASRTQGISDTAIFIRDYLSLIAKNKRWFNNPNNIELIEKLIDSKMAILDRYGNIKMTSGFDADNGVFYSNKTYQDNYYRKSARTTYWSDAYEDYDYYSKHTSYKNSANITSYDYSTGAYQSSKYIPLMRVKVGDTIEYDGGSESITRAEECLYYITEDNLIFYRYPCMDEEFANDEFHSYYEYIGMGSFYDSNVREIPFKANCWISEGNFLDSDEGDICEDSLIPEEPDLDEDTVKSLEEKAKLLENNSTPHLDNHLKI